MAVYKVYGPVIGSTIRPYIKWGISHYAERVALAITDVGYENISTGYTFNGLSSSTAELYFDIDVFSNIGGYKERAYQESRWLDPLSPGESKDHSDFFTDDRFFPLYITDDYPHTIPKTDATQSHTFVSTFNIPKWIRVDSSGTTKTMAASTVNIAYTIIIPPKTLPYVTVSGYRLTDDIHKASFDVKVSSTAIDYISSVVLTEYVSGRELYRFTAASDDDRIPIYPNPNDGETIATVSVDIPVQDIDLGSQIIDVVATGVVGSSAVARTTIPVAFFTMDVQKGGKEIAFGGAAVDETAESNPNGIFNCFMYSKFSNGFLCRGEAAVLGDFSAEGTSDFSGNMTYNGENVLTGNVGSVDAIANPTTTISGRLNFGQFSLVWGHWNNVTTSGASGSGTFSAPYYIDTSDVIIESKSQPRLYVTLAGGWTGSRWVTVASSSTGTNKYSFHARLYSSQKNTTNVTIRWLAIVEN